MAALYLNVPGDAIITFNKEIRGERKLLTRMRDSPLSRKSSWQNSSSPKPEKNKANPSGEKYVEAGAKSPFDKSATFSNHPGSKNAAVNGLASGDKAPTVPVGNAAQDFSPKASTGIVGTIKSLARRSLESLDRPGLRPLALRLAQTWVDFRDRHKPLDEKVVIGLKDDIWFTQQQDLILTHTALHWGLGPRSALMEMRDDFFHRYSPKEGDVVIGVGAGTGADILACSLNVGSSGTVHAIEAHPRTFKALLLACQLNNLANVKTYRLAISDSDGMVHIGDGKDSLSNSIMLDNGSIGVTANSLDSFCDKNNIDKVDLLLMNIEGAERYAIKGMSDVMKRTRHMVICCHDFRADRGDGDLMRTQGLVQHHLKAHGFRTYTRPNDPRPWVRCNVYAENSALVG